ncbi:hypothetical protein CEXT_489661 [Caerostris extrusa]|uniref:Uncharacterized protein n=1 Tax=Caerostris extrusa TaxID=172846 RepID=A0AAV4M9J3_CAEEX|nr:hypothetical protein CEXT_489661 [Caerostris extrusa]
MSYLQATDGPTFFKTFERYFDNWNMADLTDEGRLLVSLGDGNIADQVLVNVSLLLSMTVSLSLSRYLPPYFPMILISIRVLSSLVWNQCSADREQHAQQAHQDPGVWGCAQVAGATAQGQGLRGGPGGHQQGVRPCNRLPTRY